MSFSLARPRDLEGDKIAAGYGKVALSEIYSDEPTFGYRLSQPHGDRSLATAAIEDCHIGSNMSEEKLGIDIRAACFDCGVYILAC